MLRRVALFGVAVLAFVLLAAGGGRASTPPAAELYLGEWTPDTSSNAATTGHAFTLQSSNESSARALTGNLSGAFDDYCKSAYSGVQPVTYFTVTTTWSNATELGGCQSGKTGGHVYAWSSTQIWYAHYSVVKGAPKLIGVWEPTGNRNVSYKFTADHPVARFLTKVKYTSVGKKGGSVAELVTATGAGEVAVAEKPVNCINAYILGGFGAITIKVVKVGGPNLVELNDVTVKVIPSAGEYDSCDTQEIVKALPVVVKAADPSEKDACPVGSRGTLYITDRSAKYGSDAFGLEVAKCHLAVSLSQAKAKKGSHVAVALTFDEKGY